MTHRLTGDQPPLTGGPTMVDGHRRWSTAVDRRWPPLTATVDRWFGGGSNDGDGIVPTPCGTTQVVTRGKLIVKIAGLDRWQVGIRGTRYCSFGYEVAVWQWQLRASVRGVINANYWRWRKFRMKFRSHAPLSQITELPSDLELSLASNLK
ncbi:hypothetical protein Tco_0886115 [Tanacetum coccineum]